MACANTSSAIPEGASEVPRLDESLRANFDPRIVDEVSIVYDGDGLLDPKESEVVFRRIEQEDREVLVKLHDEIFPLKYDDDFFQRSCNGDYYTVAAIWQRSKTTHRLKQQQEQLLHSAFQPSLQRRPSRPFDSSPLLNARHDSSTRVDSSAPLEFSAPLDNSPISLPCTTFHTEQLEPRAHDLADRDVQRDGSKSAAERFTGVSQLQGGG